MGQGGGVAVREVSAIIKNTAMSGAAETDRPPVQHRRVGHWWEVLTRTMGGRLSLLLIAVGLIGLSTALIGHFVLGAFDSFGDALWSAVAHLVDPGSIGDDSTAAERTVGLVQVISGIIFFAGVVLTVLTDVVDRALRRLETGDPAIRRRGHLLIVGYNPSLAAVASRLAHGEGSKASELVVLLPIDQRESRDDAKRAIAHHPARTTIVVGDPADDGYERVCAAAAGGIVLLSPEGEPGLADLEVTDRALLLAERLAAADADPPVAVELRRERDVRAFWYDGDGAPRFPANFDALVNDRNIGGILSVALAHPHFFDVFLSDDRAATAPRLLPVGSLAGATWGDALTGLAGEVPVGVLSPDGESSRALYLPSPDHPLKDSDRLIVLGDGASDADGGASTALDFEDVPPSSILMVGWSDATRALLEDLTASGADPARLFLLDDDEHTDRNDCTTVSAAALDESTITDAIGRYEPSIIWVAAAAENEPAAIITAMLTRLNTDVPVLVEQSIGEDAARDRRVADGLTIVTTAELLAETAAISLGDPDQQLAREQMLSDPDVEFASLRWRGEGSMSITQLARELSPRAAPVAIAGTSDPDQLEPGAHVLVLRRRRVS